MHVSCRWLFYILLIVLIGGSAPVRAVPTDLLGNPLRPAPNARRLIEAGRVDEARQILRGILEADPDSQEGRVLLSASFLSEDPVRARELIIPVLWEAEQRDDEALNVLSSAHAQLRRSVRSVAEQIPLSETEVDDYERLLQAHPDWPELLYRLASQRLVLQRLDPKRMGELESAAAELQRLIDLLQNTGQSELLATGYFQLGRTYKHRADTLMEAGDALDSDDVWYDLAIAALEKTLEVAPGRVDAIGELVLIHRARNDSSAALETATRYVSDLAEPHMVAKAKEMHAVLLVETGRMNEAVVEFHEALRLNPRMVGSYLHLAEIHAGRGEWEQAEKVLRRSVEAEPAFIAGYVRLGDIYLRNLQYGDATSAFQRAMEVPMGKAVLIGMVPSRELHRNALYYRAAASLAWLYLEAGSPQQALQMVRQAGLFSDADPHLLDTLGSIYRELEETDRAIETYREIIEAADLPAAHFHLAEIYVESGETQLARRHLAKALASEHPFYERADAEELVKRLH